MAIGMGAPSKSGGAAVRDSIACNFIPLKHIQRHG
jgi:hypothetical protein